MPLSIKKTVIQTKGRKEFNYGSEDKNKYVGTSDITVISGSTYHAGQNIQISADNVISATDTKYVAGHNIVISGNVISTEAELYTAGDNINISSGNVISTSANVHSDMIHNIVACTLSQYNNMPSHDTTTLYLIIADYLNISPLSFSVDYTGGTGTITISSNADWTIEII